MKCKTEGFVFPSVAQLKYLGVCPKVSSMEYLTSCYPISRRLLLGWVHLIFPAKGRVSSRGGEIVSELKRKKGESFEGFIRRVKRQWQKSGKLIQAKKIQFYSPKKSKNLQRRYSVAKSKLLSKIEYLRKVGKMPPEEDKYGFKR